MSPPFEQNNSKPGSAQPPPILQPTQQLLQNFGGQIKSNVLARWSAIPDWTEPRAVNKQADAPPELASSSYTSSSFGTSYTNSFISLSIWLQHGCCCCC